LPRTIRPAPSRTPLRRLRRRAALRPLRPLRLRRTRTRRPMALLRPTRMLLRRPTATRRPRIRLRPTRRRPTTATRRSSKPPLNREAVSSLPALARTARTDRTRELSGPCFFRGSGSADMTVSVRDARYTEGDRLWIQSVYRDYLDDLAPGTGRFPILGEVGHREPDQLFRWFGD